MLFVADVSSSTPAKPACFNKQTRFARIYLETTNEKIILGKQCIHVDKALKRRFSKLFVSVNYKKEENNQCWVVGPNMKAFYSYFPNLRRNFLFSMNQITAFDSDGTHFRQSRTKTMWYKTISLMGKICRLFSWSVQADEWLGYKCLLLLSGLQVVHIALFLPLKHSNRMQKYLCHMVLSALLCLFLYWNIYSKLLTRDYVMQ